MHKRPYKAKSQNGVVMVIAMIMLLAVTLMVVSSSNLVQGNLKVAQNFESRRDVRLSAIAAIEEAISAGEFVASPEDVFSAGRSCKSEEHDNFLCYDLNADGIDDVIVEIEPPTCVVVLPTPNNELDVFNDAQKASCYLPAVAGEPIEYSMCGRSVWEFEARAEDAVTGAAIVMRQGVSILIALNDAEDSCPS